MLAERACSCSIHFPRSRPLRREPTFEEPLKISRAEGLDRLGIGARPEAAQVLVLVGVVSRYVPCNPPRVAAASPQRSPKKEVAKGDGPTLELGRPRALAPAVRLQRPEKCIE